MACRRYVVGHVEQAAHPFYKDNQLVCSTCYRATFTPVHANHSTTSAPRLRPNYEVLSANVSIVATLISLARV